MAIMAGCFGCSQNKPLEYPVAEKQDISDNYFGTEVADPYRWMEDDTTAQVKAWVDAENLVTQNYFSRIKFRGALKERLTQLSNYEKFGIPVKRHGKYYFSKNDGLQDQSVIYVADSLDAEPQVLLDPNKLSEDGTVALGSMSISKDGKYMAYTVSRSGSDWVEIYVMDLETKQLTKDHIQWAKFTGASWFGNGFFYSAYPAPEEGKEYSNVNENHLIYYHKIGEHQEKDALIYSNPEYPKRFYTAETDEDENFLFIYESGANLGNRLFMKDLRKVNPENICKTVAASYAAGSSSTFCKGSTVAGGNNIGAIEIASNDAFEYNVVETDGETLYFITNNGAQNYKIMKAAASKPQFSKWEDFIPETENVLAGISFTNGKIIVTYMQDASTHAYVCSMEGVREKEIELPTLGTVSVYGRKNESEVFYSFTSYTYPATIFKYDVATGETSEFKRPQVAFNPNDFITEQVFFESKDGTKVPMFITHRKDMELNGENPLFLYGYGGFNISLNPGFSVARIPFLERGGIYVDVNLRGGGEYGESWHLAGTKLNKQNVFDDFIAAAEWLIANKYTNSEKLCINGGSNGGLLVGAVVNQRPELYKVAIAQVGVMDMLRYHKFTIGWNWASDYGTSADSQEMFKALYAYSPLHTIGAKKGIDYPAILVTTADHDDRVVPAHSFKYTATLQAAQTGPEPKIIRIETKAGHGGGMPISKWLEMQSDIWAFAFYNLGMKF